VVRALFWWLAFPFRRCRPRRFQLPVCPLSPASLFGSRICHPSARPRTRLLCTGSSIPSPCLQTWRTSLLPLSPSEVWFRAPRHGCAQCLRRPGLWRTGMIGVERAGRAGANWVPAGAQRARVPCPRRQPGHACDLEVERYGISGRGHHYESRVALITRNVHPDIEHPQNEATVWPSDKWCTQLGLVHWAVVGGVVRWWQ
jgi:hypothetical protein